MAAEGKKVFISYRRALSAWAARAVYQHLVAADYDVFMDVESLSSGEFRSIILRQIEARPHFLVILTPGALKRTHEAGDWLRQEVEHALDSGRNIVPIAEDGFSYEAEERDIPGGRLPPKLSTLKGHNWLPMPSSQRYFKPAMQDLTENFLARSVPAAIVRTPSADRPTITRLMLNARAANVDALGTGWLWNETSPLAAPTLEIASDLPTARTLRWTPALLADGYVLEYGSGQDFTHAHVVYEGADKEYTDTAALYLGGHYRVRAKGRFSFSDSPWSNTVQAPPHPDRPLGIAPALGLTAGHSIFPPGIASEPAGDVGARSALSRLLGSSPGLFPSGLTGPILTLTRKGFFRNWQWTAYLGAAGYVLQRSEDESFSNCANIFEGPETKYSEPIWNDIATPWNEIATSKLEGYYRVGAKTRGDSISWSNVIKA
jgi:hypothetical protein